MVGGISDPSSLIGQILWPIKKSFCFCSSVVLYFHLLDRLIPRVALAEVNTDSAALYAAGAIAVQVPAEFSVPFEAGINCLLETDALPGVPAIFARTRIVAAARVHRAVVALVLLLLLLVLHLVHAVDAEEIVILDLPPVRSVVAACADTLLLLQPLTEEALDCHDGVEERGAVGRKSCTLLAVEDTLTLFHIRSRAAHVTNPARFPERHLGFFGRRVKLFAFHNGYLLWWCSRSFNFFSPKRNVLRKCKMGFEEADEDKIGRSSPS